MKVIKIFLLSLLVLSGLAVTGILGYILLSPSLPGTDEMKHYYAQRAQDLERINRTNLQKIHEGRQFEIRPDENAGFFSVDVKTQPTIKVEYYTHRFGIGLGAYGTGIAYLEKPPEKVYTSIESMAEDVEAVEGFTGYGRLEGNWYYFFWELD